MSILSKLDNLRSTNDFTPKAAQEPMTKEQVANMKAKLKDQGRSMNVMPNQFDKNRPFKVRAKLKGTSGNNNSDYKTYGTFTSVDVASAVGSLVSAAEYGVTAIRGNYDQAVVEAHDEFKAWLEDSRNAEVLAALEA